VKWPYGIGERSTKDAAHPDRAPSARRLTKGQRSLLR
jgi:hypothetical protein